MGTYNAFALEAVHRGDCVELCGRRHGKLDQGHELDERVDRGRDDAGSLEATHEEDADSR